jgi:uncharacterized MAPEG superfamily protein
MSDIIISTLALALVQIWLLPMILNLKNISWLFSSRDATVETSMIYERASRASANLQASLPAFLALCLLSMQLEVDVSGTAMIWLALRVVYIPLYLFGISMLRSASWVGSVVCMIVIALDLV